MSDADKKIFEQVLKEAATRATTQIVDIEKSLGAEFTKRGKEVVKVDRTPFREATAKLHNGPDATWDKATYDKLQALK
jgi:TRAP-type C4-dicarboxylate transport system substrate-binding protein